MGDMRSISRRQGGQGLGASIKLVCLLVMTLLLCACAKNTVNYNVVQPSKEALRAETVAWLAHYGTQVVEEGRRVKVILHSDDLFLPRSANLTQQGVQQISRVAMLLPLYPTEYTNVSAYTDPSGGSPSFLKALTARQAQVVADAVWPKNIDSRLLVSHGQGAANPVALNATANGRALNRRVNISFEYFRDYNIFN